MRYANAAERILAAIGEPQMIDVGQGPGPWQRSLVGFFEPTIRPISPLPDSSMELTIERIVAFFRHAAQGLEEWVDDGIRLRCVAPRKATTSSSVGTDLEAARKTEVGDCPGHCFFQMTADRLAETEGT
jgi:predicted Ser/Thr protein kinase